MLISIVSILLICVLLLAAFMLFIHKTVLDKRHQMDDAQEALDVFLHTQVSDEDTDAFVIKRTELIDCYNAAINRYNQIIGVFPYIVMARILGFRPEHAVALREDDSQ